MSIKKYFNFSPDIRDDINNYFKERTKGFWKKKVPVGKQYTYIVHDPFEVLGFGTGYEKLYLVGDNWLDHPEKPIAIVIGCNDWKFGFIADYLPGYRVAFGSRKMTGVNMVRVISALSFKPVIAVIWGYTEDKWLNRYLKYKKIPIWRCEDGFIRSADLGANGATPYSLVFDKTGLYYNASKPSDIENLLNFYDFNSRKDLLSQADEILQLIKELKISKYNPPSLYKNKTIKLKKIVLVIGQVDNDASIRFGNPNGWSMEDMVKLAKYENPNADVLYRPHPEIYQGYQNSKFRKDAVSRFATIISPDEHIIDLIERVDHIYTITSLTGLEALIRGKKVTVLGRPFYAGWGLTDDRAVFEKSSRARKITIKELLAASYILYPKYLAGKNLEHNSFEVITATLGRISADRYLITNKIQDNKRIDSFIINISHSIRDKNINNLDRNDIHYFLDNNDYYYNEFFSLLILGCCESEVELIKSLRMLRPVINLKVFNRILVRLADIKDDKLLIDHWLWMLIENEEYNEAKSFLEEFKSSINFLKFKKTNDIQICSNTKQVDYQDDIAFHKRNYDISMSSGNYDNAKESLNFLALNYKYGNINSLELLKNSQKISFLMFDFISSKKILEIMMNIDVLYSNRMPILEQLRTSINMKNTKREIFEIVHNVAAYKPDKIYYTGNLLNQLDLKTKKEIIESMVIALDLDNDISPRKINAYLALENFDKAEKLAEKNIRWSNNISINDLIAYSQALSYRGKVDRAINLMESYNSTGDADSQIISEILRLYIIDSQYEKALKLLENSMKKNILIGEMYQRKVYFGNKLISKALLTFKDLPISKNLFKYYGYKYKDSLDELLELDSFLLLSIFGPGDEIRFASIYGKLMELSGNKRIVIATAPRLVQIFQKILSRNMFYTCRKA